MYSIIGNVLYIKCNASFHRASLPRTLQLLQSNFHSLFDKVFDGVVDDGLPSLGHGAKFSFISAAR